MFNVKWDALGEKTYELGLDRGVLYPPETQAVPWNGLVSVDEDVEDTESESIYFNGLKRFQFITPGQFKGQIRAFTYPEEFVHFDGYAHADGVAGMILDNQYPLSFGMSYRTMIYDDANSESGYKIHLLYNLTVEPSGITRDTMSDSIEPNLFSWSVQSLPVTPSNRQPTAHIIFDTRYSYPEVITTLETILYGSDTEVGRLPTIEELEALNIVIVTDLGDGTFEITGPESRIYEIDLAEGSVTILVTESFEIFLTEDGEFILITEESAEDLVYELDILGIHEIDLGSISITSS